jgi:hypothetical protein
MNILSTAVPEEQETPRIFCANLSVARWTRAPMLKSWLQKSLT